jgi:ankyrin repeat protein
MVNQMLEQNSQESTFTTLMNQRIQDIEAKKEKPLYQKNLLREFKIMHELEHTAEMQAFLQRMGSFGKCYTSLDYIFYEVGGPISCAIRFGDYEAVRFFIDIDHTLWGLNNLLREACLTHNIDIIKLILERGAYINSFEPQSKQTPLSEAIKSKNNHEVVEFLLENGATLDVGSLEVNDDINLVNYLKENYNISSDQKIDFGTIADYDFYRHYTPALIHANDLSFVMDQNCNVKTVKLLISYGENINDKDISGKTALDYALKIGNRGTTIPLLENGADIILGLNVASEERHNLHGMKKTLVSLSDALKAAKNNPGNVMLNSHLTQVQLNDKELIISALKGQLIISNDAINIYNTINFILEVSPETNINELSTQVKDIKLFQIKQNLIKKGIPEKYNSFKEYLVNTKISIEKQESLTLEAIDFIDNINTSLYNFAIETNSLLNLTLISFIESVVNGEKTLENLAISINKQAFMDVLDKKSIIFTKKQLQVKNKLVKIWQAQEVSTSNHENEQKNSGIALDADVIEDQDFLPGNDPDLFS